MGLHQQEVDRLLAPDLAADLSNLPLDELRLRRDACQRAEVAMSYARRVLQGELDLVAAELDARLHGVRGDAGRLVDELPTILAGSAAPPAHERGHSPRFTMTGVAEGWSEQRELALEELVAEVLSSEALPGGPSPPVLPGANLGAFSDDELRALVDWLRSGETSVSAKRRALHDRIDLLQAAIVARYKVGAADADTLLG
jgi:hypothetical protein